MRVFRADMNARRAEIPWPDTRFDIVSIVLERPPRIEWLRDAF